MYMHESDDQIPIRKARSMLANLTDGNHPVILLNFHNPCAILVPIPHAQSLTPRDKTHARARLRRQFADKLWEALPKGR